MSTLVSPGVEPAPQSSDSPAAEVDPAGDTPPTPVAPRGWRRLLTRRTGTYALVVGLGIVLLSVLALSAQRPTAPLDPDGTGPEGARALAEVLRDQGVEVDVVRSIGGLEDAAPDRSTTVLVADPTSLGPGASARLREASEGIGRLVLVDPSSELLAEIGLPVESYPGGTDRLPARCDSPLARDDDEVGPTERRFLPTDAAGDATGCFPLPGPDGEDDPSGSGVALLDLAADGDLPATVLVGFGSSWVNETVATQSNAGLAIRVLGSTPRLVWYAPGSSDLTAPGPGESGAGSGRADVWPVWTTPVLVLLAAAIVLLALVRGRRLGRLVREPLPVVVRAAETTQSRGRLYRRAGDRPRTATVLRLATRDRLARRLAVPPGAGDVALVHAVSSATGLPAQEVSGILSGPDPVDDSALIQLAQQLTDLEERVRHP